MAMKRNVKLAKNDFDEAVEAAGAAISEDVNAETVVMEKVEKPVEKVANGIPKNPAGAKRKAAAEKITPAADVPARRKVAAAPVKHQEMVNVFNDLENQFIAEFGMLPRVKASNGNCMDGDGKSLGVEIAIQVLSWNRNYIAGPCSNDAPTELVKYSVDRESFEDGTGFLDTYIADLRAAGWADACVKEYYDVVAVLAKAEKDSELVGEMVQLQLSPTSVKAFNGFRLQTAFKIARGLLSAASIETIIASAEVVSSKGNTWTKFAFRPLIK